MLDEAVLKFNDQGVDVGQRAEDRHLLRRVKRIAVGTDLGEAQGGGELFGIVGRGSLSQHFDAGQAVVDFEELEGGLEALDFEVLGGEVCGEAGDLAFLGSESFVLGAEHAPGVLDLIAAVAEE